ncbi:MAG TPA: hypothetical protein VGO56_09025 [Pyrinomonadaceae bacterium]|nr:hypothetical protein [Pyrinomonadaceae bacterium]
MKSNKIKLHPGLLGSLALLLALCLWPSQKVNAQGVGSTAKEHIQEMDRRELQLSDVGRAKHREADPRARALMEQVNEDFQHLLQLHNRIVRDITSNNLPDTNFISDATGEIKKRASRLQSTLGLHRPETAETKPPGEVSQAQTISNDLIALCKKIESFMRNPIIETPGTVDAHELERARRDLAGIVELSGVISKRTEKQKH